MCQFPVDVEFLHYVGLMQETEDLASNVPPCSVYVPYKMFFGSLLSKLLNCCCSYAFMPQLINFGVTIPTFNRVFTVN